MKIILLMLTIICASACLTSAQRKPLSFTNSTEMFELLDGKWAFNSNDCQKPFIFKVASDRKSIKLTYQSLNAETNKEETKEFTYKILDADNFRIRTQMEDEKRLTEDKKIVVWDFYFFSLNEFRWHRTDWAKNGFTPPAIRCETKEKRH